MWWKDEVNLTTHLFQSSNFGMKLFPHNLFFLEAIYFVKYTKLFAVKHTYKRPPSVLLPNTPMQQLLWPNILILALSNYKL